MTVIHKPASVAQLDRALASDNCDIAGFRLVFARYSAIYVHKNAVVNGSQYDELTTIGN